MAALRCCRKPRKGATPVPGPTMMRGTDRRAGGLKLTFLRHGERGKGVWREGGGQGQGGEGAGALSMLW